MLLGLAGLLLCPSTTIRILSRTMKCVYKDHMDPLQKIYNSYLVNTNKAVQWLVFSEEKLPVIFL